MAPSDLICDKAQLAVNERYDFGNRALLRDVQLDHSSLVRFPITYA
jgi:hypothetical protein